MLIEFNALVVLLAIVISQSLLAIGLLVSSRKNRLSNRILAILIMVIALWLSDDFMRIAKIYRQIPNLYFLPIFYSLSFGPLIYFYVKSLVNHNFEFKTFHLLHFIPVIIQASLYIFLTFCSYDMKQWYWENVHRQYTYRIEFDGTWISMTTYLILSFRLLQNYQAWILNNFSELSKIKLNWLKIILVIMLVLCIQWFVEIILRDLFGIYFEYDFSVEILGVIALVLGISGIKQSNLSEVRFENTSISDIETKMTFTIDRTIMEKIEKGMTENRLYLNPTLNLVQFANALKLPPKVVSRHINSGYEKSFNDFVNGYRIEEVKQRLKSADLQRLTIFGIALDSGFNSKSTFNRIFKEFVGMAPSDYIK